MKLSKKVVELKLALLITRDKDTLFQLQGPAHIETTAFGLLRSVSHLQTANYWDNVHNSSHSGYRLDNGMRQNMSATRRCTS